MSTVLGILVRSDPYSRRGGRESLDPALAAATLEIPLKVFFVGDGILHLLPGQQTKLLPANQFTRAWGALTDLSDLVELYVDSASFERVGTWEVELDKHVKVVDSLQITAMLNDFCSVIQV